MHKFSTSFSVFTLASAIAFFSLLPTGVALPTDVPLNRPDFLASGIDPMPVGTAKQMKRLRRVIAERKA